MLLLLCLTTLSLTHYFLTVLVVVVSCGKSVLNFSLVNCSDKKIEKSQMIRVRNIYNIR